MSLTPEGLNDTVEQGEARTPVEPNPDELLQVLGATAGGARAVEPPVEEDEWDHGGCPT